jgi:hypothetical protein
MRREPTRPDLIARYENLGYPNRLQFEAKHGLPANMIGCMKLGKFHSAQSADSIARLEAAVAAEEASKAAGGWAPPVEGSPPVVDRGGRPPVRTTLSEDEEELLEELIDAINTSTNQAEVDQCNKKATVALLRGVLTDATARIVKEMLAERRQSIHAKEDREEKARAGRELMIRVVFVRDWTGGPLPSEAAP